MLYWLIPYLVAYNASDHLDWNYGPEHIFKVKVRSNLTSAENNEEIHSDVSMEIFCRPRHSSLLLCQIKSPMIDNYDISSKNPESLRSVEHWDIGNLIFHISFNDVGVAKITYFDTRGYFRLSMIQALADHFNVGIDLREKKLGNYLSVDKSIYGICETNFEVRKFSERDEKKSTHIAGYEFDVVALGKIMRKEPIVIVKRRMMDNCSKKTPYMFGQTEENMNDGKRDFKMDYHVMSSQSTMYLGRNSFSSYTENTGIIEMKNMTNGVEKLITKVKTGESILISLVMIRPVTVEL